jgi:hypothetical protein
MTYVIFAKPQNVHDLQLGIVDRDVYSFVITAKIPSARAPFAKINATPAYVIYNLLWRARITKITFHVLF